MTYSSTREMTTFECTTLVSPITLVWSQSYPLLRHFVLPLPLIDHSLTYLWAEFIPPPISFHYYSPCAPTRGHKQAECPGMWPLCIRGQVPLIEPSPSQFNTRHLNLPFSFNSKMSSPTRSCSIPLTGQEVAEYRR